MIFFKGTIIIVAIYINNNLDNYNYLIKCLKQLRYIYKDSNIITVDNNSLNKEWYNIAKELEMILLENNSEKYRYDIGAYKFALNSYRANKYIFIQGTIFINEKIDLSFLDINKPNVVAFSIVSNGLNWTNNGLLLINEMLNSINMDSWNNEPIVLWNCFCANNLFIENMLNDKIFDIECSCKNHACAFERILGCYFSRKNRKIDVINEKYFLKIFLNQEPHQNL